MTTFTNNERAHYTMQKDKAKFGSPEEENEYAKTQYKPCSKCKTNMSLDNYMFNTSGDDCFSADGTRRRRPECKACYKLVGRGKSAAKKRARELGMSYKPPDDTTCEICGKMATSGNKIVFDHCHENDEFRGWICNSCNRSTGALGDNVDGLITVINYLLKFLLKINRGVVIIQNAKTGLLERA